jgi:hypothetical protein
VLPEPARGRPQRRIGRYLVTGRVGRGGMGVVYRGLDEALEREVALKTLTVEGTLDAESRLRFEVEAKAAARLQHPNIVTVYELGEDRGLPFIAMEMLPGADLEALLRSGEPMALGEKLDVVIQVCRGLAYAHERGIVHRDIKPSNVRLLDDGTAKIMDFGIAKLGSTHLTKTGMMVGTVHYMSPEQVRGQPLDGRSDIFSVGVILYELLVGQRPFRGEGATQILYKIVHEEPPPPDLGSLGELGPRLEAILSQALAKDREERFASAAAMADALATLTEEAGAATAVPSLVAESLATARRAIREGHVEDGLSRLQTLATAHPSFVDARRALRAALREQQKRLQPPSPQAEDFPELEATVQASPTRLEAGTRLAPTVGIERGEATAGAGLAARGRSAWPWAAVALVVVAGAAVAALVAERKPIPAAPLHVPVRSQPMGASVLLDGRDTGVVTNGELVLPPPAPAHVQLTFRKAGHRDETRTVRLPLPAGEAVSVTLQVATSAIAVRTRPPGATVSVDGERVAGKTPLEIALDPGVEHKVAFALEGYEPRELSVPAGETRPLEVDLDKLPPPGAVAVLSEYPLDVLWHGRPLARDQASPRVEVASGRQTLTLVSTGVFLRQEVEVEVPPGGEVALPAPPLGRINVRANPDNCEVLLDGTFVDYPPILDRKVAAGRHVVGFRWPDGARSEQTTEIKAGAPSFVVGRKE